MDELLEQFLIEGRELVADAHRQLDLLVAEGSNAAAVDAAFRAVHTLKGSVAIFDMAPAERLLHAAEDMLERARKSGGDLPPDAPKAIVACIDQIDRWIDAMERDGLLSADAAAISAALIGPLTGAGVDRSTSADEAQDAPWLRTLKQREQEAIARTANGLTAFRYTPDADCFFRGDDPLALVAAVPDLVALTLLPEGSWPSLEDWDPFRCLLSIEGLSAAPLAELRQVFRLVPDQIALALVTSDSPESGPGDGPATGASRSLRVDGARIDRLADHVGELVVATNALTHLAAQADRVDSALGANIRAAQAGIERVAGDVHRSVLSVRLVSLAPTLRRLPRLAREIAAGLDKPLRFEMTGEAVEVDKAVADGLFEPLLHLVRNAIDHGLETPAVRKAAGKSPDGLLRLSAERDGDEAMVCVSDDGAGIDPAHVRSVAVARGLIAGEAAELLSDAQATQLIFAPGFSTSSAVTDISGRGVGMDAVQAAVDRLRGRIEIDSQRGRGTTIRLRFPLNAITTRLLVVRAGEDRYGVPLDQIVETARVEMDQLLPIGTGMACVLRGRTVPVLNLPALLGTGSEPSRMARLLITETNKERVAVQVDGFEERIDALVRERTGLLSGVPGVMGTALLGDGGVLLVLDLPELVR
jgi:two-component system chemotaxis sensor kinase CheA